MDSLTVTSHADAQARIERANKRLSTFVSMVEDVAADKSNAAKRIKAGGMLRELTGIRSKVESDLQIMEASVNQKLILDVSSHDTSSSLADTFDTLYYELLASADMLGLPTTQPMDSTASILNQSINPNSTFSPLANFHLPKRKFPTFAGNISEWQGFENLFQSILSHVPMLPDVERFEILKTSLEGEALALVKHLPVTVMNYKSAWEILRSRYGNKRDLARHHLDGLLSHEPISRSDAHSIRSAINSIVEHVAALNNLGFATTQWSPMLIHIFEKSLDRELRSQWELSLGNRHLPSVDEFVNFLRSHLRSAEAVSVHSTSWKERKGESRTSKANPKPFRGTMVTKVLATSAASTAVRCEMCPGHHEIRKCPLFLAKSPKERFNVVKERRLCINCLKVGHSYATCTSKFQCRTCNKTHHSLLHFEDASTGPLAKPSGSSTHIGAQEYSASSSKVNCNAVGVGGSATSEYQSSRGTLTRNSRPESQVLLSTCLVQVKSVTNEIFTMRALLDSGAEASFITDNLASQLSLHRNRCKIQVNALSGTELKDLRGIVSLEIGSPNTDVLIPVKAIVVPTITDRTPHLRVEPGRWVHLSNVQLADPQYYNPGPVDLLLGADIFPSVIRGGVKLGQPDEPIALETIFGWVLMGRAGPVSRPLEVKAFHLTVAEDLDSTIKKFWEVEEPPTVPILTAEEVEAERVFQSTVVRTESGRFMVSLPFRTTRPILGESRRTAQQRLMVLEQRLQRNPVVQKQYQDFMEDYLACQHMERVPVDAEQNPFSYYIPHHCVFRPDSTTTKLRVVFNASSKTSTGQSLNEMLLCGPKLLPDLQLILLRARLPKYLFMADIKQMYRQILISPEDRDYLRILWRFNSSEPVSVYRLCTVTYGTTCAPHQALRTLRELAVRERDCFPLAADILMTNTYVDDVVAGAETEEEAILKQTQLLALCQSGKFELRKWASNCLRVLRAVPEDSRSMDPSVLFDNVENEGVKVLGIQWNPREDMFSYKLSWSEVVPTKRSVLSEISKVFDPLGLLAPVTFLTKHLMQRLWIAGIGWDDPVPVEVAATWARFHDEFHLLGKVLVPRRITCDNPTMYQLHVFTDSSTKGYAAAIYMRVSSANCVSCFLVTAKSRVAPLKCVSIPRLELCAAVLGAKLLRTVSDQFQGLISVDQLHAWTDSTTVLAWIRSSPHRWATFVANRTSQLQDLTAPDIWRYVPTKENPVDCASRGLFPSELVNHQLWWTGPSFLIKDESSWPEGIGSPSASPESELRKIQVNVVTEGSTVQTLLMRWSSWEKIKRIVAYCMKWRLRTKQTLKSGGLSLVDLEAGTMVIVRSVQQTAFREVVLALTTGRTLRKPYRHLDLFMDSVGLIRVGGRIRNADIPYTQKHPALLPKQHRLTEVIIDAYHSRLNHQGATALQVNLQRDFWIISARQAIRSRVRRCIPCFRQAPKEISPKMSSLPSYRLQQVKAFAVSGVDYAGPLPIKLTRGRSTSAAKAYICLFVCMNTKAVHLELSSDLSTESFLMALSRFAARRGPIQEIHSDCGTNFVGASNLLGKFTSSESYQSKVTHHLAARNIRWCFNPPAAPHFGGLWEAGVKSTKTLLLRTVGAHRLTYEELNTVLIRIEATLNSRPLCAVSNDPTDLEALTPGHFLTLEPSVSLPDPSLTNVPMSKLQRWRLIADIHQCFWSRWRNEYLVSLQVRWKWTEHRDSLKIDDVVLIKEPTPPMTWRLGRIAEIHPGSDGVVRVATVKTQQGTVTRPVVKLCPLPQG